MKFIAQGLYEIEYPNISMCNKYSQMKMWDDGRKKEKKDQQMEIDKMKIEKNWNNSKMKRS